MNFARSNRKREEYQKVCVPHRIRPSLKGPAALLKRPKHLFFVSDVFPLYMHFFAELFMRCSLALD